MQARERLERLRLPYLAQETDRRSRNFAFLLPQAAGAK